MMTKETAKVLKTIHELMEKHGLTAADIDGHVGGKQRAKKAGAKTVGKKSAATVKYRDPKTGATWTGHGRAPQWIAAAKNRDRFLVDGGQATAKLAYAGKAKTVGKKTPSKSGGATGGKGQRKGPQPALYRDPKSGKTWGGRGRAPAWLAGAKDRARFLIASPGSGAAVTATSKSKAAAKKAIAKNVVAKKAPGAKKVVASKQTPAKKAPAKKPTASRKVAAKADVTVAAPETSVVEAGA